MFERIEGDNPDRIVELPGDEFSDDGFEVGPLDLGFVALPLPTPAVDDEVSGLVRAIGHHSVDSGHCANSDAADWRN
jgi:hypothetical protein